MICRELWNSLVLFYQKRYARTVAIRCHITLLGFIMRLDAFHALIVLNALRGYTKAKPYGCRELTAKERTFQLYYMYIVISYTI